MSCKKNMCFFSALAMVCLSIFFSACNSDITTMLDDYNSHYTPTEDVPESPGPGDADFCSIEMLHKSYTITDNESLELTGPPKCKTYNWQVTDPYCTDESNIVEVNYPTGCSNSSRNFTIYVPGSGLLRGVYQITLTVTGNDDNTYTDTCDLIIYKHTN